MKRKLVHFDRNEAGNLHCDDCGYDLPGTVVWCRALIGTPCPQCGANMLTARDYESTERMFKSLDWLNRWFGWLPFLSTANPAHPKLRSVGIKIHDSTVEIDAEPRV